MLRKYKTPVIFISGDIHMGEMLTHPNPEILGHPIYEMTTSGLSHGVSIHFPDFLLIDLVNYFVFTETFSNINTRYFHKNYGSIEIDWNEENI